MKCNIKTKAFWMAALNRALRTILQVVLAMFTAGTLITDVNWKVVGVTAISAGLYSLLTSILAGLPEDSEAYYIGKGIAQVNDIKDNQFTGNEETTNVIE